MRSAPDAVPVPERSSTGQEPQHRQAARQPGQPGSTGAYSHPGTLSDSDGLYYRPPVQSQSNAYFQPGGPADQPPANTPAGPYNTPAYGNYPQQGSPNPPSGASSGPNTPFYQNASYSSGGPFYPGGRPPKNNKPLIVAVSVIVGLCFIGGGVFALLKLSNKDNYNNTSLSDNTMIDTVIDGLPNGSDALPTPDIDIDITGDPSYDVPDATDDFDPYNDEFSTLDSDTQMNIASAFDAIGIDIDHVYEFFYYSEWFGGPVYTSTYEDSVMDILLYEDGTVFSIETGGYQLYLIDNETVDGSYFTGYTTHYDESYPSNGYIFYQDPVKRDIEYVYVLLEVSDEADYVVVIADYDDETLTSALFLEAGTSWYPGMPRGDYYIEYAAGSYWQGLDDLFGPETVYFLADDIYTFDDSSMDTPIRLDAYGDSGIAATEISGDEF